MLRGIVFIIIIVIMAAAPTMAYETEGRLGVTVKAGALAPLRDDFIDRTSDTDTDLAYGGGLIYGFTRHLAGELDVTHAPALDVTQGGLKVGEASMTDVSLGLQYRFAPETRIVPYLGAGFDFITGEFTNLTDDDFNLDWTVGGHVNAGIDWFLNKSIALSVDVRGVYAAKGSMESTSLDYDPTSLIATVGFRLLLPDDAMR